MKCVAHPVLLLLATCLVAGSISHALAQDADAELRLETDMPADEAAEVLPTPGKLSKITIGDDAPVVERKTVEEVDAYAQQGVSAGAFMLFPSLEIASVVSSNARQSATKADADVGIKIKPSVRIESNWSRHSLTGTATGSFEKFTDNTDISSLNGDVNAALRLDIRRTTTADFDWSYSATSEGIGSSELPVTATSNRLDQSFGAGAGVTHDFGGIEGKVRLAASRNIYGDVDLAAGGKEDNADRDYTSLSLSARTTLKTGSILQPFAEVAYVPRLYDDKTDRNGVRRSSQGVRLKAGLNFADDPIWTGTVAASLEHRNYDDASLDSATAPGLEASLTWRPTDLTRFEFNAGTSLAETVSLGESATTNWNIGLRSVHELRDNLEAYASLQGDFERAAGSTDVTTTAGVGLDWTLNPFLVLSAGYEGVFFNGQGATNDYAEHRLLTSIVLRR